MIVKLGGRKGRRVLKSFVRLGRVGWMRFVKVWRVVGVRGCEVREDRGGFQCIPLTAVREVDHTK